MTYVSSNFSSICFKLQGKLKSIETFGMVKLYIDAYRNKSIWYKKIVSDDDSTLKACLKHSYREKINGNSIGEENCPVTKTQQKSE